MKTFQEQVEEAEEYLKGRGISIDRTQINEWRGKTIDIREVKETGQRAILLYFYNLHISHPMFSVSMLNELILEEDLEPATTPNEQVWLTSGAALSEQQKEEIAWNSESLHVMLWATNKLSKLELPLDSANTEEIANCMPEPPVLDWLNGLTYRDASEIAFQADLTYKLHCAIQDAELKGIEVPGINPRIVYERHCAFNWLLEQRDQSWDDVSTDT